MAAPSYLLTPSNSVVIGVFTFKFTAGLALTVQFDPNLGDVMLRQLPALTPNVTITADDMATAHQLYNLFKAQPYVWGVTQ